MTASQELMPTGIEGLDAVLGGGILPNALIFVIGPPGAGKTVLGCQMLFAAARNGISSVILTARSEGHEKLLQHIRAFTFFDQSSLGSQITLLSAQTLTNQPPEEAISTLVRTIRETGTRLVLIDGFQGLDVIAADPASSRVFLASLATQMSYLGVTVMLTVAGDAHDKQLNAMLTIADVIIGLSYTLNGVFHMRCVELVKSRGRAQLPGVHSFHIDSTGIVVRPRLEVYPLPRQLEQPSGVALFGLPDLDKHLGGGITAGTTTALAGAPGVGKTLLALTWALQEARSDQVSLFISFRETQAQLIAKGEAFGLPVREAIESGALRVLRFPPVELEPDEVGFQLMQQLQNAQVKRLVIDDSSFLFRSLGHRVNNYCAALVEHFYGEGLSSLCTLQIDPFNGFKLDLSHMPISVLAENLIVIQQVEEQGVLHRLLAVLHMRFNLFNPTLREIILDPQGIRIVEPYTQDLPRLYANSHDAFDDHS